MTRSVAEAFAPASVGNVAVGFDVLGHVHGARGDRVVATRTAADVVVTDSGHPAIPTAAAANTASVAARSLLDAAGASFGVSLVIEKGIPLASGLGGSAASAVGAVIAVNALLDAPLSPAQLYPHALAGEAVASGSAHGDNVAPSLLGGLQLVPPGADGGLPQRVPVPAGVCAVVAHPDLQIRTADARACLPAAWPRADVVAQLGLLAGFLDACHRGDAAALGRYLRDGLVEPHRSGLIPGFAEVQAAALSRGALGCSISGAGPAVFAWVLGDAELIGAAMVDAFRGAGVEARFTVGDVNGPGAHLVEEQ